MPRLVQSSKVHTYISHRNPGFPIYHNIYIYIPPSKKTNAMTPKPNKKLPLLTPKKVIGIKRKPNRRDLRDRNQLQGLPDPDPDVVARRAALEVEQAALRMQHSLLEMDNESALRASLTVLADPAAASWSDSGWSSVVGDSAVEEEEVDEVEEKAMEDAFVAKVMAARTALVIEGGLLVGGEKVRSGGKGGVKKVSSGGKGGVKKVRAPRKKGKKGAAAQVFTGVRPGVVRELTVAEAALLVTNLQLGTEVTMGDLGAGREMEGGEDMYRWVVGGVEMRELTVAEAALVITNMQVGTSVTMEDLRTAREMVDLWDAEDTFQWTVGNVG